jgi:hypothetical protein
MIDVTMHADGKQQASAEAEDVDTAVVAARCLWDETWLDGQRHVWPRLDFHLNGQLIQSLEVRP